VPDRGLQINSSAAVIQATLKGQRIALVRRACARDEIKSGQLIRLLPKLAWPISWAYYVVGTKESLVQPATADFIEWAVAAALYEGAYLKDV
jgi:LysR family transcriptional regulator, glycine cleavage system transcriptional activator